ncbi:glycerol kinase GlpK [Marinomonas balearica]|uniref:Glycerol kinase n=1 Tax=Marinomonas balearica TaxID=491947 RepID=A0A4R6M3R6_9GAMM|nr:glycerol kinase GlpK [Marinomonas balearica]TDO95937.1 glycerol kinase [Marinomonas balearica]
MTDYLLAIDQGTTSSRAILFNRLGELIEQAQQEFPQHFPNDGWVEHDPNDIWTSTLSVCQAVLEKANISASQIASIGITNQRETTLVWNIETGEPVYNAIVWQDRRTAEYCQELVNKGFSNTVHEKTGLLIDSYFSATKIRWVLEQSPQAKALLKEGKLAFGTVDSYLIWKLTDGKTHKTDATNAARTMVFNIHDQCWDQELVQLFELEGVIFPEVMDSSDDFGVVSEKWLGAPVPINGVAGDQQAALIGQACFKPGMVKSTYGTGCFLILNTGAQPLTSNHKLLTTVGYRLNGQVSYALEGSIFVAGATMQWLRDGLKLFEDASQTKSLAEQARYDSVYLVPAFTGLGAPYWDADARGAIVGLTRDTGISDIVSAGLRSVCYQTKDLVDAMAKDGADFNSLRIDGGMAVNDYMAQFLSDILEISVERPKITETTALGVAYLAALRLGWFNSLDEITDLWLADRAFTPSMSPEKSQTLYHGWLESVERIRTNS